MHCAGSHADPVPHLSVYNALLVCEHSCVAAAAVSCLGPLLGQLCHCHKCRLIEVCDNLSTSCCPHYLSCFQLYRLENTESKIHKAVSVQWAYGTFRMLDFQVCICRELEILCSKV